MARRSAKARKSLWLVSHGKHALIPHGFAMSVWLSIIGMVVDDRMRQKCSSSAHHGERLLVIPKRNNRA